MNYKHGFIVPLVLIIIAVLIVGGGAYVFQSKQTNQPVTASSTTQTSDWKTYTKFGSEFSFKYSPQWHVTEYTRNEGGQKGIDKSIVAVKFVLSQTGGTDVNSNGSFPFDSQEDWDYILVYREFMAQPECAFLTQQTSQQSEDGKVVHNPDWPDAKCVEPFGTKLPYALFTPSKNSATLKIFDQILSTFKFNP